MSPRRAARPVTARRARRRPPTIAVVLGVIASLMLGAFSVWSLATAAPRTLATVRLSGIDRWATAVAVGQVAAPSSPTVVLASGEPGRLVDGMVGAPLAATLGAPLLLTTATALPTATAEEITRRAATTAYLVGGTAAIGPAVETALRARGVTQIIRVAGLDRYGTAAAVAALMKPASGTPAIIVNGHALPDALAAGGAAAATGRPILLVAATTIPTVTRTALTALAPAAVTVVGGTAVIADSVLHQFVRPSRVAGTDRYVTAVMLARAFAPLLDQTTVSLAGGADTALVDAMVAGTLRHTILFTGSTVPPSVNNWLLATPKVTKLTAVGGVSSISASVLRTASVPTAAPSTSAPLIAAQANPTPISGKLPWAPPVLVDPITLTIGETGTQQYSLLSGRDYIVRFATGIRREPLQFNGGHNIVLIGGEQVIDNTTSTSYLDRRLLYFHNQTGTIHIEGYYGHGAGLVEGINIDAPNAIFELENSRIDQLHAGLLPQHPDFVQTFNGPKEFRIYNFTGRTDYSGFMWMHDTSIPGAVYPGRVIADRVDIAPYNPSGSPKPVMGSVWWMLSSKEEFRLGDVWIDTGWYTSTIKKSLKDSLGYRDPSVTAPTWAWQEFRPDGTAYSAERYHLAADQGESFSRNQGDSIVFTHPAEDNIWNLDKTGPGSIREGAPPGGAFVPVQSVGAHYVSPGYAP